MTGGVKQGEVDRAYAIFNRFSLALWAMQIGEPLRSSSDGQELYSLAISAGGGQLSNTGIEGWKAKFGPEVVLNRSEVGIEWDERIRAGCLRSGSESSLTG